MDDAKEAELIRRVEELETKVAELLRWQKKVKDDESLAKLHGQSYGL